MRTAYAHLPLVLMATGCFFALPDVRTDDPISDGGQDGGGDEASIGDASRAETSSGGYRAAVMLSGPKGYWRLGDDWHLGASISAVAADEIGAHPGTYSVPSNVTFGLPGLITNDANTSVAFGPSATFGAAVVSIPSFPAPTARSATTLEIWMKCSDTSATYRIPFGQRDAKGDNGLFLMYRQDSASVGREVANVEVRAEAPIANAAHHVVGTYDGSALRLYVDGAKVGETADARDLAGTASQTLIGAGFSDGGQRFIGTLDEAAIYDRALSAEEVQAHYVAGTR